MKIYFFRLPNWRSVGLALVLYTVSACCSADVNSDFLAAAKSGDLGEVSRLLNSGASINARDKNGLTALHASAAYGFNSALSFKPTADATAKYLAVVKFLLGKGADVSASGAGFHVGYTPLHAAAHYGFRDTAELLIARGAKVDARDNDGAIPLHYASRYGFTGVSDLLISKGANVNAKDNGGWTPLYFASSFRERTDYVRFLIAKGADVNARRNDGKTPLHNAAESRVEESVVLLISNGADVNAKDKDGNTPYDIAAKGIDKEFAALFVAVPAKVKPSFDCTNDKALNYVERNVCSFPPLTVLDRRLNDAYIAAASVAKNPINLRDEQREWIRGRNQTCEQAGPKCSMPKLMSMYENRITRLSQIEANPRINDGRDVCVALVKLADDGELKNLAIRTSRMPTERELVDLNQAVGGTHGQPDAVYELQLKPSGPAERFGQFFTGGSCAATQLFNLRSLANSKGESNGWVDVNDPDEIIRWAYWGGGDYPVKYQGRYFMITSNLSDQNSVNMISSINTDGKVLPLCTVKRVSFKYVADSEAISLCSKIARGTTKPIGWKDPGVDLASSRDEFEAKFSIYADSVKVARIDLNGDGVLENIGRFTYASGAGCGSENVWGRVLTDNLQNVVKGELDSLLSPLDGPFEIYLDNQNYYIRSAVSKKTDQVVRIRGNRVEKVCELSRKNQSTPDVMFEMK